MGLSCRYSRSGWFVEQPFNFGENRTRFPARPALGPVSTANKLRRPLNLRIPELKWLKNDCLREHKSHL
jgi:hypothetical protein